MSEFVHSLSGTKSVNKIHTNFFFTQDIFCDYLEKVAWKSDPLYLQCWIQIVEQYSKAWSDTVPDLQTAGAIALEKVH